MKLSLATILLATVLTIARGNVIQPTSNVLPVPVDVAADDDAAAVVAVDQISEAVEVPQQRCAPSVTTVSGPYAPTGQICQQQLVFNENFNSFDMNLWRHEVTMNGGGVRMEENLTAESID